MEVYEQTTGFYHVYRAQKILESGNPQEATQQMVDYLDTVIRNGTIVDSRLLLDIQDFSIILFDKQREKDFFEVVQRIGWTDYIVKAIVRAIMNDERDFLCKHQEVYDFWVKIAFQIFEEQKYEDFLMLITKLQKSPLFSEDIMEDIQAVFVDPNLQQYEVNYRQNAVKFHLGSIPNFESVRYLLIPTEKEDRYFLLDRWENEIIDFVCEKNPSRNCLYINKEKDAFSDYLISGEHSPFIVRDLLKKEARKYHVVIDDAHLFFAYLQMDLSVLTLDNFDVEFFFSPKEFIDALILNRRLLPRNHCSRSKTLYLEIEKEMAQIHQHRIDGERKEIKPLLAIGIPTWNRGDFAFYNVLSLLASEYDDEIEILVSDNDSNNDTVGYYKKISELKDSRVRYIKQECNRGFGGNILNVLDMAAADYVLYTADTDLVRIENLHLVLAMIRDAKEPYGEIHTNITGKTIPIGEALKGKEAVLKYMLTSNSLAGLIYNAKIFRENRQNIMELIRMFQDNYAYQAYSHSVLEMILLNYGNMKADRLSTIIEYTGETLGKVIDKENAIKDNGEKIDLENIEKNRYCTFVIGKEKEIFLVYAYSIKGRIDQHIGFFRIFLFLYEKHRDRDYLLEMHRRLCYKTLFLAGLNLRGSYLESDVELKRVLELLEEVFDLCIYSLDKIYRSTHTDKGKYYEFYQKEIRNVYEKEREKVVEYYEKR